MTHNNFVIPRQTDYSISCGQITGDSGELTSIHFRAIVDTHGNEFNIHPSYQFGPARKTIVLITVQPNHIIWLHFKKFATEENHFIKVSQSNQF